MSPHSSSAEPNRAEAISSTHEASTVLPKGMDCPYPAAICDQLRWVNRRVFYQFLYTGCPEIDLEADLSIAHNQADLAQRLQEGVPTLCAMPPLLRGPIHHDHSALLARRTKPTHTPTQTPTPQAPS